MWVYVGLALNLISRHYCTSDNILSGCWIWGEIGLIIKQDCLWQFPSAACMFPSVAMLWGPCSRGHSSSAMAWYHTVLQTKCVMTIPTRNFLFSSATQPTAVAVALTVSGGLGPSVFNIIRRLSIHSTKIFTHFSLRLLGVPSPINMRCLDVSSLTVFAALPDAFISF